MCRHDDTVESSHGTWCLDCDQLVETSEGSPDEEREALALIPANELVERSRAYDQLQR